MTADAKSLIQELLQRQHDAEPVRCSIGKFLTDESIDSVKREGIRLALQEKSIYGTTIASVIGCSDKAVQRHRAGRCLCSERGV